MKKQYLALLIIAIFTLIAVIPVSATDVGTYYQVAPTIDQGATVYIGEQGLDITNAMASANAQGKPTTISTIGWWSSLANIRSSGPDAWMTLDSNRMVDFYVNPFEFDAYSGDYYLVDFNDNMYAKARTKPVFTVKAPELNLSIWDFSQNKEVSGMSVPQGDKLGFQVKTNMYTVLSNTKLRSPVYKKADGDGYIDIRVQWESAGPLTSLHNDKNVYNTLSQLNVNTQPWTWGDGRKVYWGTAIVLGQDNYPPGTYRVWALSKLNNMQDNYLNGGAQYTGRTISETKTVTIV